MGKFLKQRNYWLATSVLLASFLVLLLVSWGLINAWKNQTQPIFDSLLAVDMKIEKDFQKLRKLNQNFAQQQRCTGALLKAMRLVEFHSIVIREYGFIVANQLLCTTTLGILKKPILQSPNDIQAIDSDVQFARSAPIATLEEKEFGMRTRIGHFQAFIRHIPLVGENVPWIEIGLYTITEQGIMPILKYDKIQPHDMLQNSSQQNSDGYSYWYEKGHWVEQFCYKKNNCAIVAINLLSYFKHQLEILFIITIFLIISASLTFAISCRMYKSYMVLGRQLKRGLNMRQVECVYQPIFSMKNNYLEGCEVLCRWRNEDGEQISPNLFIGEIEKNGQSRLLTKIVLKKAVAELTHAGIFGQIRTAINTFPDDIASNHINKLIDNEVPSDKHHTITIEVTEKEIDDLDSVVKNIDSLQRQHVKFAIDDFGTGYSNFQHLAELGVDYLKIDQSFVRRIEPDSLRGQLVNNMVKIAHTLQLKTVAEGVEKQEQFDLLKKMGVDFSQGYLHAKPMPIEEFSDYVKGHIKPF